MNLYLPKLTASAEAIEKSPNTPRLIKQWIATLSIVNAGATTREFYKTIQVLNRQNLSARHRLELMESLRPIARQILQNLYKQLSSMTLPLSPRDMQINKLVHSLLTEMSVGYKHVVHNILAGNDKLPPKLVALATHRAMRYLGESQLQHEKTYTLAPDTTWHDIHRLQRVAENQKLITNRVIDTDFLTIEQSTILDVYSQICLFSLCQPFRLRLAEIEGLHKFLETGVSLSKVTKSLLADEHGAVFVASLRSSEPPGYIPLADITTFSNLRGFDLSKLMEYLKSQKEPNAEPSSLLHTQLSPLLARKIEHILGSQEKRRFSRVVTKRTITIALSLRHIVNAIEADKAPELSKNEQFPDSSDHSVDNSLSPLAFNSNETLTNISVDQSALYSDFNADDMDLNSKPPARKAPESWREWHILNSGAAGYGLQWGSNEPCLAHVGEIIAIREKEYNIHHWRIGMLKWIRNNQPESIDIGVQLLAPRAIIVSVDTLTPGQTTSALMLPGMKAVGQPPSFICPPNIYSVGDKLDINMLEKNLRIELKAIGESPGTYTQFFYKAHEVRKAAVERESFDDLWSKL